MSRFTARITTIKRILEQTRRNSPPVPHFGPLCPFSTPPLQAEVPHTSADILFKDKGTKERPPGPSRLELRARGTPFGAKNEHAQERLVRHGDGRHHKGCATRLFLAIEADPVGAPRWWSLGGVPADTAPPRTPPRSDGAKIECLRSARSGAATSQTHKVMLFRRRHHHNHGTPHTVRPARLCCWSTFLHRPELEGARATRRASGSPYFNTLLVPGRAANRESRESVWGKIACLPFSQNKFTRRL